jgi:hypothetical protein
VPGASLLPETVFSIVWDMGMHAEELRRVVSRLRKRLSPAFSSETASEGATGPTPSAGHCAIVALIVHQELGGDLVSTTYAGTSHWFNRLRTHSGVVVDVDLTGDQFGFHPVRIDAAGMLFRGTRLRPIGSILNETVLRAIRLARRAGLARHVNGLRRELAGRVDPADFTPSPTTSSTERTTRGALSPTLTGNLSISAVTA